MSRNFAEVGHGMGSVGSTMMDAYSYISGTLGGVGYKLHHWPGWYDECYTGGSGGDTVRLSKSSRPRGATEASKWYRMQLITYKEYVEAMVRQELVDNIVREEDMQYLPYKSDLAVSRSKEAHAEAVRYVQSWADELTDMEKIGICTRRMRSGLLQLGHSHTNYTACTCCLEVVSSI